MHGTEVKEDSYTQGCACIGLGIQQIRHCEEGNSEAKGGFGGTGEDELMDRDCTCGVDAEDFGYRAR